MNTKYTSTENINTSVLCLAIKECRTAALKSRVAHLRETDTKFIKDDEFPNSKTDRCEVYNNLRRKKHEYYKRKHENFPERDTPREKSARKYNKWRTVQYIKIEKRQGLEKTKLCRSVTMGCECKFGARGKCRYAHSVEELVIPMCFFGKHCHCKRTCKFPHTEEERQKMQDEKRAYVKKRLELKQSISNIPVFEN